MKIDLLKNNYKEKLSAILQINDADMDSFSSSPNFFFRTRDFLQRGTIIALFDLFLSFLGAELGALFGLILMFVVIGRIKTHESDDNYMLAVFGLWTFLFPTRLYSIWYQNFYSFNTGYLSAVPLIACITYCLCTLIYVFFKYKNVRKGIAVITVSIVPIVTGIFKINPNWINYVGRILQGLDSSYLIFIWCILVLTMTSIASIYDDGLKSLFFKSPTSISGKNEF